MKKLASGALFLAAASLGFGQVQQPGQLEINPLVNPVISSGHTYRDVQQMDEHPTARKFWYASMIALAAGTSFDMVSSVGKVEGNAFLANRQGEFGSKGILIKSGALGAVLGAEWAFHKHSALLNKFAIGNFAEAGIFTGVAVHNLGVKAPK